MAVINKDIRNEVRSLTQTFRPTIILLINPAYCETSTTR